MSETFAVGLLFADRVITEDNGKKTIVGTFTTMGSKKFPVVFPPWYVYSAFTDLEPEVEHSYSLNITLPATHHVLLSVTGKFKVQESLAVPEIIVQVTNTIFPEPGKYLVELSVDGHTICNRFLSVVSPDRSEEEGT